jgi:hypothetical protein
MSELDHAPEPQTLPEGLSPLAKIAVGTVATAALSWFLISWLVMHSPLTDAIGETVGALAVVLLVVSVVGMARGGD